MNAPHFPRWKLPSMVPSQGARMRTRTSTRAAVAYLQSGAVDSRWQLGAPSVGHNQHLVGINLRTGKEKLDLYRKSGKMEKSRGRCSCNNSCIKPVGASKTLFVALS